MSNIIVRRFHEGEDAFVSLFHNLEHSLGKVREKAFELFERRGGGGDRALNDWLEAERLVLGDVQTEMKEKEKEFEFRVKTPGFTAEQIEVLVTPGSIVIQGEARKEEKGKEGFVNYTSVTENLFTRNFVLPSEIDVEKVNATLDQGVLLITAEKKAAEKKAPEAAEKKVMVAAA